MKLSIIIPIYNNFDKLKKLLKSLSKQTIVQNSDFEVILVNDGSDQIVSIPFIKELADRVKYYKIEHAGAPKARNFGFDKSNGEYIFFCDADVIFLKNNALEVMIKKLEQNLDKAYCYCNYLYGWKSMPSFAFNAEKLKNNNYISTMSMIRRSALEKIKKNGHWDETLKRFQDWDLWLTMLEYNLTGIWVNKILWRVKADGVISSWMPKIFYKIFKNNKKIKEFEQARKIIKKKHGLN